MDSDTLLLALGRRHSPIARRIINSSELCNMIKFSKSLIFNILGAHHLDIAVLILNNPSLFEQANCSPYTFSKHVPLRKKTFNLELWEECIRTSSISIFMDGIRWGDFFYCHDISVVEQLLNDPSLLKYLGDLNLMDYALTNPRGAELLIKHPALSARLFMLPELCDQYPSIAKIVVKRGLHTGLNFEQQEQIQNYTTLFKTVKSQAEELRKNRHTSPAPSSSGGPGSYGL